MPCARCRFRSNARSRTACISSRAHSWVSIMSRPRRLVCTATRKDTFGRGSPRSERFEVGEPSPSWQGIRHMDTSDFRQDLAHRLSVARGDEPADLVMKGGRVLSVFTGELLDADVAIAGEHVAAVGPGYEGRQAV